MKKINVIPSTNVLLMGKQSGYKNTYEALAELVDNSLEKNVKSNNVFITFKTDKSDNIECIYVADDGLGMDSDTINNYFSLGVSSRGSKEQLGKYGVGGQFGASSIGDLVEVYTKQSGSSIVKVVYDVSSIMDSGKFEVPRYEETDLDKSEIGFFYDKIGTKEHGTLVVISSIYRIAHKKKSDFLNRKGPSGSFNTFLKKTYSLLIKEYDKKIWVDGEQITPINYFGGYNPKTKKEFTAPMVENGCGNIIINGIEVRYEVHDCKYMDDDADCPNEVVKKSYYDIPIGPRSCGGYFFRNGRAIALGIILRGIVTAVDGEGHDSNVRYGIYVDGDADKLLNTSYRKQIESGDSFDDEFKKFLMQTISRLTSLAKQRYNKDLIAKNSDSDFLTKKISKDLANSSMKFTVKSNKTENQGKPRGKYNKLGNGSQKTSKWFDKVEYIDSDKAFDIYKDYRGKFTVLIGEKSAFIKNIFNSWKPQIKIDFIKYLICERLPWETLGDDVDSDTMERLNSYRQWVGEQTDDAVYKVFKKKTILDDFMISHPNCVGVGVNSENVELIAAESPV